MKLNAPYTRYAKQVLFLILVMAGFLLADNYYQVDRYLAGSERRILIDSVRKLAQRGDTLYIYGYSGATIITRMDSLARTTYHRPTPAAPLLAEPADGALDLAADFVFRWHGVDSCASYRIQIGADSAFETIITGDTALTDTLWQAHGLGYRKEYYWRARGDNFATDGTWSEARRFETEALDIALTQPVLTRSSSDSAVTLGWRAELPAVCSLQWRPLSGGEWQSLRVAGKPRFRAEQTLSGLMPQTPYEGRLILCLDDTTCMDSAYDFAFETVAPRIPKVFPLRGKPAFSYIGSKAATITFATDVALRAGAALYTAADSSQPLTILIDSVAALDHAFAFDDLLAGESYFARLGLVAELSATLAEMPAAYPFRAREAADEQPPLIVKGPNAELTDTRAYIALETDEACRATLIYGESGSAERDTLVNEDFQRAHAFILSPLRAGTSYDFRLLLEDPSGNAAEWGGEPSLLARAGLLKSPAGSNNSFTTNTQADAQPPLFTRPPRVALVYDSTALLRWESGEPTRARIEGRAADGSLVFLSESESYAYRASAWLTRLQPGTAYRVTVRISDLAGNETEYERAVEFTTRRDHAPVAATVTEAPRSFSGEGYALVWWSTDLPCDSRVSLDNYASLPASFLYSDPAFEEDHLVVLNNLQTGRRYFYQAHGSDPADNEVWRGDVDTLNTGAGNSDSLVWVSLPDASYVSDSLTILTWESAVPTRAWAEYRPVDSDEYPITAGGETLAQRHRLILRPLRPGAEYEVSIRAVGIDGGELSATVRLRTLDEGERDRIAPILADSVSVALEEAGVLVAWSACAAADWAGYRLVRQFGDSVEMLLDGYEQTSFVDDNVENGETRRWGVAAIDLAGNVGDTLWSAEVTGVDESAAANLKSPLTLEANHPNPFNPRTEIAFVLGDAAQVELSVHDLLGRRVAVLAEGRYAAGHHRVAWEAGRHSGGVYFCRARATFADGRVLYRARKMLLMK